MTDTEKMKKAVLCLDKYMIDQGKEEIDEIEANRELDRAGILGDEIANPGRPLRKILTKLRDTNLLPHNVRQIYGSWKIKISTTITRHEIIYQF